MGNFASRIHSKEDGKVYNILPLGDMPTVVFGRVIKENSVPGMQYYFPDGKVKWRDDNQQIGYSYVKPFPYNEDDANYKWGIPCIFTIPDNFDYSKLSDVEYVKQFCRTAKELNANTMSPNYIIRGGKLLCIKTIESKGRGVVVAKHKYKMPTQDYNFKITHGKVMHEIEMLEKLNSDETSAINCLKNRFTLIPVGRVKYRREVTVWDKKGFYRYKQSIFHYNVRKMVKKPGGSKQVWKLKLI